MNCERNEMAVLVRNTTGVECFDHLQGLPIVTEHLLHTAGGPAWSIKGDKPMCPQCNRFYIGFLDADLQPIRGTGLSKSESTAKPKVTEFVADPSVEHAA